MTLQTKQLKEKYKEEIKKGMKSCENVDACFFKQRKEEGLNFAYITDARKTGILNLSGMGIAELPGMTWKINSLMQDELQNLSLSMDEVEKNSWWQFVDLKKLLLASNSLNSISPEIKNYQALTVLDLHDNCISDLPLAIAELQNLEKLDISRNKCEVIPQCIYRLERLRFLLVQHNGLKILEESLGNFSSLEELNVSHNCLQNLPPSIGFVSRLVTLRASHNQLHSVPIEIGNLTGLQFLDLSFNEIKDLPVQIEDLHHLEVLCVQCNKLVKAPCVPKGHCLKEIHCGYNDIREIPNEFFEFLSGLKLLDLKNNKICELPANVSQLQRLESLYLANNNLSGLPFSLGLLLNLNVLTLDGNPLKSIRRDVIQRGTTHLLKWLSNQMQEAEFGHSKKDGYNLIGSDIQDESFIASLDKFTLSSSKVLNLSAKNLTHVPDVIIECAMNSGVSVIDLSKNKLTFLDLKIKHILLNLTELNLSFNMFECFPEVLQACTKLQYLDIRGNKIDDISCDTSNWQNLREINVSFNKFKCLPKSFCSMKNLEIIIASDNVITEINVNALFDLPFLRVLDLHNNDIEVVPPELGKLTHLRSLSLEGNKFRHPRPSILAKGTEKLLKYLQNQIRE